MDDPVYFAALSWNEAIGPRRYDRIRSEFKDLKNFFALKPDEMINFLKIKNENIKRLFLEMLPAGEKIVKKCSLGNIKMINREDKSYHPRLRDIPDPPFVYYQIGNIDNSNKITGIVGTRNVSREASSINEYFTGELVKYNIGIASGLAIGHDSIAHRTALLKGGFTIAVLGSGIDVIYPSEHKRLYDEICLKGAVISEYPPGAGPFKTHFPLRNRIISGLSEAVLLIQAPEKSGSLITAKYAADQGRELYVLPGNPMDPRNKGSNDLIRYGAKIALDPFDIITDIMGTAPQKAPADITSKNDLTSDERKLIEMLSEATQIDNLIYSSGMDLRKLNHILNKLEMLGLVTQFPGRIYSRKL